MLNKKNFIRISVLLLLSFVLPMAGFALDETATYSLEEIFAKGLERNPSIKSAEYTLESVDITRDRANINLIAIPAAQYFTTPAPMMLYSQALALDWAYDSAKDGLQIEIDSTKYDLIKKYQGVLNALENFETARKNMDYQRSMMDIAVLKYNMGIVSSVEKMVAIQTYDIAKNTFEQKKAELDKAYIVLNSSVGFNEEYRYNLEPSKFADIEKDLQEADLQALLASGRDGLIIKILERGLDQTEFSYNFYVFNSGAKPLDAIGEDIKSEEADIAATKDNLIESIRTLFINAQDIQKNYKALLMKDETDRKLHEIKKIQYDLGMITKMDIMASEKTLLENEANLIALRNGYNEIIFMLNYPHAASMS